MLASFQSLCYHNIVVITTVDNHIYIKQVGKMIKEGIKTFENTLLYAIEKTALYYKLKGAQLFNGSDYGITTEQYCVLEVLYYSQGDVCQRDISKKILKDRSNTSRLLSILEEKNLATRTVDTKQKRLVKNVVITPEGKELYERIFPIITDSYWATLEGVTLEELEEVKRILGKIRENLSKDTTIQI